MLGMRRLTLASVVLVGVCVVGAAPAAAKSGYGNICPALEPAICMAGATSPRGVAVDNTSGPTAGDVWALYGGVLSSEGGHVVRFDAAGKVLKEFASGPLEGVEGPVVVDPTSGDVYVSSLDTLTQFNPEGQPTGVQVTGVEAKGAAVGGEGDVYIADAKDREVKKFSSSGVYIASIIPIPGEDGWASLAVGPEGNVYMAVSGEVKEYSSSGAPVDCPGTGNTLLLESSSSEASSLPPPIAIDPSNGHLFTVGPSAKGDYVVAEYSSLCATEPSNRFGNGEIGGSLGVGVNGSTHAVYVGDYSYEGLGGPYLRAYGLITVPTVATGASASDVTRTSAVVNGAVNPEGIEVTICEFEYGPTTAYGSTAPCSPAPPFSGAQLTVSANLSFVLAPGAAIHYRLKAGSAGGVEYGHDEAFTRAAPPTVVGTLPASGVSQFAATLNGTIETGEEVANYHFEYGTSTAYGQIAPIPDNYTPVSNEPIPIAQPLLGLQAGTTYHYRLIASSPGGTNVAGPDMTFTTPPIPTPTVATGASEGVGVGSATLTGTIDPHGWDTTYLFEYGPSTAYGSDWPTIQVDMGALEGPQPVLVNVPNLLPGTTYHYRLVASNGGGTSYGPDMTFTTGEYPVEAIREPVALRTLLIPTGEIAKAPSTKKSKKAKKRKKAKARHPAKRSRGHRKK
jgi:hypothetical protein